MLSRWLGERYDLSNHRHRKDKQGRKYMDQGSLRLLSTAFREISLLAYY